MSPLIFITLYEGNGWTETDMDPLHRHLKQRFPQADVEIELVKHTEGSSPEPIIHQCKEWPGDPTFIAPADVSEAIKEFVDRVSE